MCWQCTTPPWRYLPDAKLYGNPNHDHVVVVEWEGLWAINPDADWGFTHEALPGDVDQDGLQYFTAVQEDFIFANALVPGEELRSSTGWRWRAKDEH